MSWEWRIFWAALAGLVCVDWAVKAWLLAAFLCATCGAAVVALTPATAVPPAPALKERISQAGVHYGGCAGVTLAIVLLPEPCGWEGGTRDRIVANR